MFVGGGLVSRAGVKASVAFGSKDEDESTALALKRAVPSSRQKLKASSV